MEAPGRAGPQWEHRHGEGAPAEVDRASLSFGRTGDEASLAFCGQTAQDVNADGRLDLVCHFTTQLTGFLSDDTEGVLKGKTVGEMPIEGRDAVRVIRYGTAIAGLLLTTECVVVERKEEKSGPALPAGGGMGGMS